MLSAFVRCEQTFLQCHRISALFCTHLRRWSRQEQTVQLHITNCDDWMIFAWCLTPYRLPIQLLNGILYLRTCYHLVSISYQFHLSQRRGNPTGLAIFHQPLNHCHRYPKLLCSCLLLACSRNTNVRTGLTQLPREIHPFFRKDLRLGKPI